MEFGYMGLSQPLETVWADGRKVTVYPNGKVVDESTGSIIRSSKIQAIQPIKSAPLSFGQNNGIMILALVIIGAIAIVAVSKK